MNRAEAEAAYAKLLGAFEREPISPNVRSAWLDYLAAGTCNRETFNAALARCVASGGSAYGQRRGQRPNVAEFAALVRTIEGEKSRTRTQDHIAALAAEPPGTGKLASEWVARIKAQMTEHLRGRYRPHAERREGVAADAVKEVAL